jgi:hypothetical protein
MALQYWNNCATIDWLLRGQSVGLLQQTSFMSIQFIRQESDSNASRNIGSFAE